MNRGIDKTKFSLIDFTLSDTTQFYSSIGGGLGVNGLKNKNFIKSRVGAKVRALCRNVAYAMFNSTTPCCMFVKFVWVSTMKVSVYRLL